MPFAVANKLNAPSRRVISEKQMHNDFWSLIRMHFFRNSLKIVDDIHKLSKYLTSVYYDDTITEAFHC